MASERRTIRIELSRVEGDKEVRLEQVLVGRDPVHPGGVRRVGNGWGACHVEHGPPVPSPWWSLPGAGRGGADNPAR